MTFIDIDNKDVVRRQIESKLKSFALSNCLEDVFYSYDINFETPTTHTRELVDLCKRFKKRKQIFFSSNKGRKYFKLLILDRMDKESEFRGKFENKLYKKDKIASCICKYDKRSNPGGVIEKQHDFFSYEKKFEIIIPCEINKNFFARFVVMTNDHTFNELRVTKELKSGLVEVHNSIVNEFIRHINPLHDYQHVKQSSLRVLECLASGMNREEIAEKLHLTVRGVDYHIDLLKSSLISNNIANLVYKACTLKLLT
ncbi:helix-turn-helix transcriptional regulator [Nitrincola sp.]|uniref:helix-turn-helix transcriptional regulator n=1 Tax=Nitrincola sp. TaxID=1926584 RepID=UPI003A8CDA1E